MTQVKNQVGLYNNPPYSGCLCNFQFVLQLTQSNSTNYRSLSRPIEKWKRHKTRSRLRHKTFLRGTPDIHSILVLFGWVRREHSLFPVLSSWNDWLTQIQDPCIAFPYRLTIYVSCNGARDADSTARQHALYSILLYNQQNYTVNLVSSTSQ